MTQGKRFLKILAVIVVLAATYYFFSTDRTSEMVLIGTVDANQVIVSPRITGRIEKLLVDEGSQVKQGDLIAELDTAELQAQKRAAEATLASLRSQVAVSKATETVTQGSTSSDVLNARSRMQAARAQFNQAQAELERLELDAKRTVSLAEQGVASQQDREHATAALRAQQAVVQSLKEQIGAAEAEVGSAEARTHQTHAAQSTVAATQAQVASAQAQVAQAEARLAYTKVYAPVSGTVSVRAAREGEVVNPGEAIVTITDLSDTWVRAAVAETYADKIALGDTLNVRMPSGAIIPGKVIFKNTEGDFATQRDVSQRKRDIKTVALKLRIENPNMAYATGMTAEVLVPQSKLQATVAKQSPSASEAK